VTSTVKDVRKSEWLGPFVSLSLSLSFYLRGVDLSRTSCARSAIIYWLTMRSCSCSHAFYRSGADGDVVDAGSPACPRYEIWRASQLAVHVSYRWCVIVQTHRLSCHESLWIFATPVARI
jgi:hypothetical protein